MTLERIGARLARVVASSDFARAVEEAVSGGARFAALLGVPRAGGEIELCAILAEAHCLVGIGTTLPGDEPSYPSLSLVVPAAAWYERELHDRYGVVPVGHPRLDPLVLPLRSGDSHEDVAGSANDPVDPDPDPDPDSDPGVLEAHASGEGLFTIPYGPVRSGVFESVEYLIETFGEDIPRVRSRIHHKHRAIDARFLELSAGDGVQLAERVEGTVSVAHAVAYCLALETLADRPPTREAELVRVVHAELERIVNHLESMIRHTEGAYQVAANARLAVHKERLMRLRGKLCGSRFGRGVVVPGGVRRPLADFEPAGDELAGVARALGSDLDALMATPSFLDRLRNTGVLPADLVAAHGALGPVGRGSGSTDDTRAARSYGAYGELSFQPASPQGRGDALARQQVRLDELRESLRMASAALAELARVRRPTWCERVEQVPDGSAISAVEAPQGELIYLVEMEAGRLTRVKPRCAAFHNFAIFPQAFRGDIFTDFVFIEASFGISIAGVSG